MRKPKWHGTNRRISNKDFRVQQEDAGLRRVADDGRCHLRAGRSVDVEQIEGTVDRETGTTIRQFGARPESILPQ